jgi:osmotically-inducible protein OsmY
MKGGNMLKQISSLILSVAIAWLIFGINGRAIAQTNTKNLQSRVESALDAYYMPDQFNVTADEKGKVTIEGQVNTFYDKLNMFQIVAGVKGVVHIDDNVVVNTPTVPDDIIKANIIRALRDNSVILEPDKISVSITQGLVILKGTVSYSREKLMAETVSSWEDGVLGIDNEIDVLPPKQVKTDENLKSILNEIIENKFPLVKGKVSVDVKNGDVTLTGEVGSPWEKINLKKEFMRVLGVRNVVENLTINAND